MAHTIHETKTRYPRTRREVLRRPGIGHGHPAIKAEEEDNGADEGHPGDLVCDRLPCDRDQDAPNECDHGHNRQPVFALQPLAKVKGKDRERGCLRAARSSIRLTISSAFSTWPVETSQREDSGSRVRRRMRKIHRNVAMMYISRQPIVKDGPASAKGSPRGNGSGAVVSSRPSQMPRKAPRAELMKINDV